MPWQEVKPMDEKILFLSEYLKQACTFTELCSLYGISRKTGYKWVQRYEELGLDGLSDQSRKPHSHPAKIPYVIRQAIIDIRKRGRIKYGAKKIASVLQKEHPDWEIPSKTTIYNILKQEGLIHKKKRRRRVARMHYPFLPVHSPNDVWTTDFKGQFLTDDGKYCYPLTVMDYKTRYLLGCKSLTSTGTADVKKEFSRIFQEYGLPLRIRSDNGVPFAAATAGGLSALSIWWIKLGIIPERIEPGKPQQNGKHEKMHKTLKDSIVPSKNVESQQEIFNEFIDEYNNDRPHECLSQETPASHYYKSSRQFPDKIPEMEYPGHFLVSRIGSNGVLYKNNMAIYVNYCLGGERVGLDEVSDGIWDIYFGPVRLGYFDRRDSEKSNKKGYILIKV